jgi:hypothetical protein
VALTVNLPAARGAFCSVPEEDIVIPVGWPATVQVFVPLPPVDVKVRPG